MTSALLSDSEQAALTAALVRALVVAAKARSADSALFFQFVVLRDDPARAPAELRELLEVVAAIPALEIFIHAQQVALGNHVRVGFHFLSQWLVARAQQVGCDQAVADLLRYLKADAFEVSIILAVDGVVVDQTIKLQDYELVSWEELTQSETKWQIAARASFSGTWPTAALVQRRCIERAHLRPWDPMPTDPPQLIEPMLDILRCVTAVAGAGIRLLHYWFEPPEWAPWAVSRSTFGVDTSVLGHYSKPDGAAQRRLVSCVSCFLDKSESDRARLRVPLDRLNRSYLLGMRSVDSAIELGVAIEALYAPSKLSEGIGFAVRTRAAKFLGGSLEDRKRILAAIRDVYDLRSLAVHAGRFDVEHASRKWRDEAKVRLALAQGQRLVAESLMRVLEEGEPAWEDLDIGAA
jgi:hypothetical protein